MLKKIAGVWLVFGFAGLSWAQPIDLNQATEMALDGLKGVGPALTKELMRERQKAPFKDWDDVTLRVKGIGPHKASTLSAQAVRVHGSAYAGPSAGQKPAHTTNHGSAPHTAADPAKPLTGNTPPFRN